MNIEISPTPISRPKLPALIAETDNKTRYLYLEFFAATIRNPNTRQAYLHALQAFSNWCVERGVELKNLNAVIVAAYIETHSGTPATIKQHLSALRRFFDFLVVRGVLPQNPVASVKAPREIVRRGKTPCPPDEDMRALMNSFRMHTLRGLRDRALIACMFFTFARVSAVVALNVGDFYQVGRRYFLRLREKGGAYHPMPAHHLLEEYLERYIATAALGKDKREALFQAVTESRLNGRRLTRYEVYTLVRRRCRAAGLTAPLSCHSFRAAGITNYRKRGGSLEMAQQMAGHASADTTRLYDRSKEEVTLSEVERVVI